MTDRYHLRRSDKEIGDEAALFDLLAHEKLMTLAMCREGEPYLVALNYGFDRAGRCFYFHCAPVGKKLDFLRANPRVWGQVVQDRGYLDGECDHAYRSVHFEGSAEFVDDFDEKRRALELMIDQLEKVPGPVKARALTDEAVRGVCIVRVRASAFTGKQGPKPQA